MPVNLDAAGNGIYGAEASLQSFQTRVDTVQGTQLRRPQFGLDLLQYVGRRPPAAALRRLRADVERLLPSAQLHVDISIEGGRIFVDFREDV